MLATLTREGLWKSTASSLWPVRNSVWSLTLSIILRIVWVTRIHYNKYSLAYFLEAEVKAQAGTGFAPWLAKYAAQVNEDGVS